MKQEIQFDLDSSILDGGALDSTAVYCDLSKVVRLDLRHHYSGPIGVRYWLSLCNSPDYGHRKLAEVIESHFAGAIGALNDNVRRKSLNLVSLGPGDGDIDHRLLRLLQENFENVRYVCIDISFELLRQATSRVLREPAGSRLTFPIRAIWGDFTKMGSFPHANETRLFSLTGFTFGNHHEPTLIDCLWRSLSAGDFLFMDARLHELNHVNGALTQDQVRSLVHDYASDLNNQFAFGPVELATTSLARDASFGYDVTRSVTAVPGGLNVITYCKDLRTRMRLTGDPIDIDRLNLASTTLYKYSDLVAWLSCQNFQLIWYTQAAGMGLFLLRKPL